MERPRTTGVRRTAAEVAGMPVTGLSIGATKESVAEARAAIMDILRAEGVDQNVKAHALTTLTTICAVNNTSVTGCSVNLGSPTETFT